MRARAPRVRARVPDSGRGVRGGVRGRVRGVRRRHRPWTRKGAQVGEAGRGQAEWRREEGGRRGRMHYAGEGVSLGVQGGEQGMQEGVQGREL